MKHSDDSLAPRKHPHIPIRNESSIERAMRKAIEEDEAKKAKNKALDNPPVDKMKHSPVIKK